MCTAQVTTIGQGGIYLGTEGFSVAQGKFTIDKNGNTSINGTATLTVESGIIQSGGTTKGKYFSFNQDGGTIAGWIIGDGILQSKDGNITLKSTETGAEIDIRGVDSGRNYFQMGSNTAHPEVSGLNVTQPTNGGISFRTVTGTQYGSISYEPGYTAMVLGGADWRCNEDFYLGKICKWLMVNILLLIIIINLEMV